MMYIWINESVNFNTDHTWWRHQMETFSALLTIWVKNSPVPGEFPTQRPVTRSFDVYFDLRPNKWLSKQSWSWWFETLSCPLWRHCNVSRNFVMLLQHGISNGNADKHTYTIMYVLVWQTVYALKRGLFWCLFPELRSNEGNKHQNNTRVST